VTGSTTLSAEQGTDWEPGPVGAVDGATWRGVLDLGPDEWPVAVIVEGTWWRERNTRRRLARLEAVRELGVPDVFLGQHRKRWLLYACPYGAPRTAEVVHMGALVGARLAIQIGSCGVVGADVQPGDVVVPTHALGLDGVSRHYGGERPPAATDVWARLALEGLRDRGRSVHRGDLVSWPTLFYQPTATARQWADDGYLGVDMETAATLSVAYRFGIDAVAMLVAWDEVLSGRSFLDPLPEPQSIAFEAADEATFAVALELVGHLAPGQVPSPGGDAAKAS
jgi:uridine phosphorylase